MSPAPSGRRPGRSRLHLHGNPRKCRRLPSWPDPTACPDPGCLPGGRSQHRGRAARRLRHRRLLPQRHQEPDHLEGCGIIVTNNAAVADTAARLRHQAPFADVRRPHRGRNNLQMTEMQATIGLVQVGRPRGAHSAPARERRPSMSVPPRKSASLARAAVPATSINRSRCSRIAPAGVREMRS